MLQTTKISKVSFSVIYRGLVIRTVRKTRPPKPWLVRQTNFLRIDLLFLWVRIARHVSLKGPIHRRFPSRARLSADAIISMILAFQSVVWVFCCPFRSSYTEFSLNWTRPWLYRLELFKQRPQCTRVDYI